MSKEFVANFPLVKGLINSKQAPFDIPEFTKAQNVVVEQKGLAPFHPTILHSEPRKVWQDGVVLWTVSEGEIVCRNLSTKEIKFTTPSRGGHWFLLPWGDGLILVSTLGQYVVYSRSPEKFDTMSYSFPVALYWTVYNGQLFYITEKIVKCSKIGKIDFTIDATNEAGAIMLPSLGMAIESIGARLFAFCSDGLYTINIGSQVLGLEYYKPLIIQHPYAVSSDSRRILFLDHTGKLHSIWYNGESQVLGYDNLFDGKICTLCHCPALDVHLIFDGATYYLLKEGGLTSTTHQVYGAYYDEDLKQVFVIGEEGSREVILESQIWIFAQTSLKLLRAWELHADVQRSDKMSVGFKLHYATGQVHEMPRFALRHSTIATPSCTANRIQYILYGTSDAFTKLEMVKLRWQRADFSQIRGADASGIAG